MTLNEIYEHYDFCWSRAAKSLGFGLTALHNWRKKGYIPIRSQLIIEKRTMGVFRADLKHTGEAHEHKSNGKGLADSSYC
jgi:hypothetical protein